jgi:hypothetical protein
MLLSWATYYPLAPFAAALSLFNGQIDEEISNRVKSSALSASIPVDLRPQNIHPANFYADCRLVWRFFGQSHGPIVDKSFLISNQSRLLRAAGANLF